MDRWWVRSPQTRLSPGRNVSWWVALHLPPKMCRSPCAPCEWAPPEPRACRCNHAGGDPWRVASRAHGAVSVPSPFGYDIKDFTVIALTFLIIQSVPLSPLNCSQAQTPHWMCTE